MIELLDITKIYPSRAGSATVLRNINVRISPGQKIGILGRNGAGKSTLIRILSGAERPTSGTIERSMSVSWPLAFGGAFQSSLTGMDNARFICRIYNVKLVDHLDFIRDFTELGKYLNEPLRHYSTGMRARLAFALSMVIEFDCFLIDEVVAVGDAGFRERCENALFIQRNDRAMIMVSHDDSYISARCDTAFVLKAGELCGSGDVAEAISIHHSSTSA